MLVCDCFNCLRWYNYSKMLRPLSQHHNGLKVKSLKGNAIGLNLVGLRKMLTEPPKNIEHRFKRFNYALQSKCQRRNDSRKDIFNNDCQDVLSSNEEKDNVDTSTNTLIESKSGDFASISKTDPVVSHKTTKYDAFIHEVQSNQTKRRYRMRDEFGNIVHRIRWSNPKTRKVTSTKEPKRRAAESSIRLSLNIRCFKIGTLSKISKRTDTLTAQCTFTVDYIEIANDVRIEASEITSCEWCTVQRLPCLFLQTTPAACLRLRAQNVYGVYEDDLLVWYDCQSKNEDEKYLVLVFEKELTFPEQLTLEEIFTEIGRKNYICSFPIKLTFEEAYRRLKTHNSAQKQKITEFADPEEDELTVTSQHDLVAFSPSSEPTRCEITTLSVSDSDDDLLVLPSSPVQEIKKLVVYPPPPAKGGITITEEDLRCLEEGIFLNDVIVDFYLRFLVGEQLKSKNAVDCHVFSSFFFKHLTQEDHRRSPGLSIQELRHNRVKTWTRHVNIFEKDFVFVPINQKAHWYLAVICFPGRVSRTSDSDVCISDHSAEYLCDQSPPNPMSLFYCQKSSKHNSTLSRTIGDLNKSFWLDSDDDAEAVQILENRSVLNSKSNDFKRPCILIMDSLHCRDRSSVIKILQEYLQEEWRVKKGCWQSFGKGVMDGWSPRVPQQDNFTDCGIYLLQYVERFLKDPPQTFHPRMDLNDWFSHNTVKKQRQQIKTLILKLHSKQMV